MRHVYLLSEGKLLFSGDPAELTCSVENRVVRLTGFEDRRRHVLTRMLDRDEVLDGTIQGRSVRLLLKTPDELEARERVRTCAGAAPVRGRLHRAAGRRSQGHQRAGRSLSHHRGG